MSFKIPAGGSFAYGMPGALPVPAQAPVAPAPIVGAMPAPPVTIKRDSCAEIGMELAERYRQVIENGWRKINATSGASAWVDIWYPVTSELNDLCYQGLRALASKDFVHSRCFDLLKGFDLSKDIDFSKASAGWIHSRHTEYEALRDAIYFSAGFISGVELCLPEKERDQILLFLAKLPYAEELANREYCEDYVECCYHKFNRRGLLPHVREAVVLNAIANDHIKLLQECHLSLFENPQFFALAYLTALEKKGPALDMIMTTLVPASHGTHTPFFIKPCEDMKNFSLLVGETFSLLAKGMRKKISIVTDYIQREPFDLDTVMLVWKTLCLDDGLEKETVIASLEAKIGSLPDGEEKGKFEAFRNKIRESR